MWRGWNILAITVVAVIGIKEAQPADTSPNPAKTEEVTVTGEAIGSFTSASPEESAKQKTQVPGAFTIKSADEMKLGRASSFEDLLQHVPGVFLQSENGAEVSKISIRGSGITSEDEPLGVMFLLDGLRNRIALGNLLFKARESGGRPFVIRSNVQAKPFSFSTGIPFTAITASREFPSIFMKRNFFTKHLPVSMPVQTLCNFSRLQEPDEPALCVLNRCHRRRANRR